MKKVISIFLAALMLMSSMVFMVAAADVVKDGVCNCGAAHSATTKCHCCVFCPNLDKSYLTSCAKTDGIDGYDGSVCCYNCEGIFPCDCGCECCVDKDEDINDGNGAILSPGTQDQIVDGFQKILKQISDWFDKIFDAIFEFLRFGDIMGGNKE